MSKALTIYALHGFTGGGADFAGFAQLALPQAHWICPDLPGHGAAPHLPCGPDATIETIEAHYAAAQTDHREDFKILLGYSMGGRASLLHACAFEKKWDALVLISCNPGIEAESERSARRDADLRLASKVKDMGVDAFIQAWQEQPLIQSQRSIRPDWFDAMQRTRHQHSAEGLAASLIEFGQGSCPNLWPQLTTLNLPVLLISGTEDKKYRAICERMSVQMNNSKHTPIAGAGHMPHLEQPEQTADILRQFVQEVHQNH